MNKRQLLIITLFCPLAIQALPSGDAPLFTAHSVEDTNAHSLPLGGGLGRGLELGLGLHPDSLLTGQELSQVVVTGTRSPKLLMETPVLTQVISHADIEKTDATNIKDLLQQVMPGVEFSFAQNQMVHLNFSGFGGQSVLILVDGERLAGETMDDVDFTRLAMDNVDHIEIVKGAASALYGSNANGGVINFITKEAAKKLSATLDVRLAKHNEQRYGLALQGGGSRWSNVFNMNRTTQDNYDVHSADGAVARTITTIFGDRTWNFADKAIWQPLDRLKLTGRGGFFFRQVKRSVESPERYRDFTAGAKAQWTLTDNDILEGSYSFDQYDKSTWLRRQKLDMRSYSNVQNSVRLLYNHTFGDNVLTAGADYLYDYLNNTKLDAAHHQQSADVFAQFDWKLNSRWEFVGALRYDYFSDHHIQRVTPKFSVRHTPIDHLNVRFGYGMGFRAPTLKEKYYDFDMIGIWTITGNPLLKPEVSHNFNLSVEYVKGNYGFLLAGYCNRVTNKITSGNPYYASATETMPRLPYVNIDRLYVAGFEATARVRWNCGLDARLSYAFVDEQVGHKDGQKVASPYLPARKHSLTAHADWTHRFSTLLDGMVALDGRFLSGIDNQEFKNYYKVEEGTITVHYPAYTLWKLSAQMGIGKHLKLTFAVDNLLNYRPKYYYLNSPIVDGTNVMVGCKIRL